MKRIIKNNFVIIYVLLAVLFIMLIGSNLYLLSSIKNNNEFMSQSIMFNINRVNKIVEINKLETEMYKYLVNPSDWRETLKRETGFEFELPDGWSIEEVVALKDKEYDKYLETTILLNIGGNTTYPEFGQMIYENIKKLSDEFQDEVLSFKDGKGYYEIKSFSETTYNNIYYDFHDKRYEDYESTSTRNKIKIVYLENTNQVKIEINKY